MSSFKKQYPDFAAVEKHVRAAHAQRAVAIATLVADGIGAVVGGLRRLAGATPAPATPRKTQGLVVKTTVA